MSAPTFVPGRGEVWYADGNTGFYALRLTNGIWPFTTEAAPGSQVLAQQTTRGLAAPAATGAGRLPVTGASASWGVAGVALALAALAARRLSRAAA
jgi:hypothetical protein